MSLRPVPSSEIRAAFSAAIRLGTAADPAMIIQNGNSGKIVLDWDA